MIFLIENGINKINMEEEYKQIELEPNYEVSNFGNVRNIETKDIKNTHFDKNGYKIVSLNGTKYKVHRLVAIYFVKNDNIKNNTIINHKDENKTNNVFTNLEWCTNKYNTNYGTNIDRMANALSKEKIIEYDINGNIINIYRSLSFVSRNVKSGAGISDAIRYNYFNRVFNNKYYFLETERFDIKRKGTKRIYYLYKKNDFSKILCKGSRIDIANYLHLGVKQIANYINYYNSRNRDIVILDYIIKIELL